ncbi:hypothetical protein FSB73_19940 [Arachidicoccus ginsenosidivorans]|uniref:Uncharacterized protein n=1 Tax=Arachidicoccus ginsenosidivorans TaxID=496057 RepID=A0A5B8VPP2_9BACT|nr:hypothetical protein [Arachidicoccus ginsenosidivorans]QEC73597.1 hypothetical protein FSB73_19940 [Arachidicoccus ginsenosidivorans]
MTHNIFTNGNKYNIQGSMVASKSVTPDFGLGSSPGPDGTRKGYVFNSQYYQFKEKIYKEFLPHFYGGAGLEFDIRRGTTMKGGDIENTPYGQYNTKYGFKQDRYNANGFLFDLQYTTRDNQNRAYKGIYANAGIRLNQSWMGSSKNATQLNLDLRKYVSLSKNIRSTYWPSGPGAPLCWGADFLIWNCLERAEILTSGVAEVTQSAILKEPSSFIMKRNIVFPLRATNS